MTIHIAYVRPTLIDPVGNVVDKNDPATTISAVNRGQTEMRVQPGGATLAPNSTNYPTIEQYLVLEDAAGFTLRHMDNQMIVTQS